MELGLFVVEFFTFCLAWWLGLYLLGRDLSNPQLRYAGLGLVSYALALAADMLSQFANPAFTESLAAGAGHFYFYRPCSGSALCFISYPSILRFDYGLTIWLARGYSPWQLCFIYWQAEQNSS